MNQVENKEIGKKGKEIYIPKNIFVLCTGRCGSKTFSKAAKHITNYTVGHESRAKMVSGDRLQYPQYHIEVDNRLSWFLNRLGNLYPDALFIHLRRNTADAAISFSKNCGNDGILDWWWSGVHCYPKSDIKNLDGFQKTLIARDYVRTVNHNIEVFLMNGRKNYRTFDIENSKFEWENLWESVNFEGDYEKSLQEWDKKYNCSKK